MAINMALTTFKHSWNAHDMAYRPGLKASPHAQVLLAERSYYKPLDTVGTARISSLVSSLRTEYAPPPDDQRKHAKSLCPLTAVELTAFGAMVERVLVTVLVKFSTALNAIHELMDQRL